MQTTVDAPADDVARLRRCLNDLVAILTLPALWAGGERERIVATLLDALLEMLRLTFVSVRLHDLDGGPSVEMMRVAAPLDWITTPAELRELLDRSLGLAPSSWPSRARAIIGDVDVRLASAPLGLSGEFGFLIVACERPDFPQHTERLLIDVASNQAAVGLQQARLLVEEKRRARVVDERVAQRTFELAVANEQLRREIAERGRTEAALDRARSELAHVARVSTLSTLTASIAHEVNQPLSGIITNAGTCLRMLDADPPNVDGARETARRTIRDGNRAANVIARLRALFSKKEFALESMDLNEATREVAAVSLSDLQRNGVALQLDLADDLPVVTGDRVQLQQVVLNLLRNGADAMIDVNDRTRQLRITTARDENDHVRLTVRDVGVGVDPVNREKIFDAFFTTKSEGMGIGLSVSRSIVERHHGRLWIEPNDGPGVSVAFSIPTTIDGASAG